jgi:transcriptional regulator with XRE-family HTH domain/Zn-dependent peptidase ImmA (M78 family)
MADARKEPWLEAGYSDIVAARASRDDVMIEFANGDTVTVSAKTLGLPGDQLRVEPSSDGPHSIRAVMGSGEAFDVSWEQVRSAADPDFAQELRRQDADEARRLGRRLKALREDRGLSQRALAQLIGMSAPQLSKIESGFFDLRVSTVHTLLRAMGATLADIAGPHAAEVSQQELRKRARRAGVPGDMLDRLLAHTPLASVSALLVHAFDWSRDSLANGVPTNGPLPVGVRYKSLRSQQPQAPLVNVSYRLSVTVRTFGQYVPYSGVPADPAILRRGALAAGGRVTLHSLLQWADAAGVPVIPVHGRGGFSAAAWTVDEVPVVVLKETREFMAFWLFDLAHELGHIARGHVAQSGIMDVDAPDVRSGADRDEQEANEFALQLLLPDHEVLIHEVRVQTRGNYLRFKGAVAAVAASAGVSAGLLGMVAAYEMQEVGEYKDRWGSASNLARSEGSGRPVAQQALWRHLSAEKLPDVDKELVTGLVGVPGD